MSLNSLISAIVEKGIVLRILFNKNKKRHFRYVTTGRWAHLYGGVQSEDPYVDALLHASTTLEDNIDTIEYVFMPAGFNLRWFLTQSNDITEVKELFESTKNKFTDIRNDFNSYMHSHIHELQQYNFKTLKDEYFIRNYPENTTAKNAKQLLDIIKQDIINKYFIIGSNTDEIYTLPACTRIGLAFEHFKSNDVALIKCCKRKWFDVIKLETHNLIGRLNYEIKLIKKNKKIKNKDKAVKQLKLYIKMLQGVNRHCLKNCDSIEDILSFWPSLMQPKPIFVYDR